MYRLRHIGQLIDDSRLGYVEYEMSCPSKAILTDIVLDPITNPSNATLLIDKPYNRARIKGPHAVKTKTDSRRFGRLMALRNLTAPGYQDLLYDPNFLRYYSLAEDLKPPGERGEEVMVTILDLHNSLEVVMPSSGYDLIEAFFGNEEASPGE